MIFYLWTEYQIRPALLWELVWGRTLVWSISINRIGFCESKSSRRRVSTQTNSSRNSSTTRDLGIAKRLTIGVTEFLPDEVGELFSVFFIWDQKVIQRNKLWTIPFSRRNINRSWGTWLVCVRRFDGFEIHQIEAQCAFIPIASDIKVPDRKIFYIQIICFGCIDSLSIVEYLKRVWTAVMLWKMLCDVLQSASCMFPFPLIKFTVHLKQCILNFGDSIREGSGDRSFRIGRGRRGHEWSCKAATRKQGCLLPRCPQHLILALS